MDSDVKAFARSMFRLKVYQSNGQSYEDLFVRIMQYSNPDFKPIKPQGAKGDRKNDGYDNKTFTYYQVYAPDDISNPSTQKQALEKLKRDYKGLKAYWEIKKFYYVLNDKYQGPYVEIETF